ncbi:MAG: hypothetical protein ACLQNG_12005 [Acidimicrobiales bacterium]
MAQPGGALDAGENAAAPIALSRHAGESRRLGRLRLAVTVVGVAPFAVAAALEMARGWLPASDDAVITFRAWATFSAHAPMLGQPTLVLPNGLSAHDLGPLEYWLLAVPVHLDPAQGALWGAALLCSVAIALAVSAAWSVQGWPAAAAVVAIVGIVIMERPAVVLDPVWNPNIGLVFFIATAALGWAVAYGRFGYWPWLVLTASLAAQCHLMFALPAAACCVLCLALGLASTRHWNWWVPLGLAVGIACWLAPIVQEATGGSKGNVSLLLHMSGGGRALGLSFGLRALAAVVTPGPTWYHGGELDNFMWLLGTIGSRSSVLGGAVIALGALGAVVCWMHGRRALATLWAVLVVLSVCVVFTLASYPVPSLAEVVALGYIDTVTWPIGLGLLAAACWSGFDLVRSSARRVRERGDGVSKQAAWRPPVPALALALLALGALPVAWTVHDEGSSDLIISGWKSIADVRTVVAKVRTEIRPGAITVLQGYVGPGFASLDEYGAVMGVLWGLYSSGYRPEAISFYAALVRPEVSTLPSFSPGPPVPTVTVSYSGPVLVSLTGP